ncbi:MAG: hypothetical protein LBB26_01810 [Puniceicoccales bacterium]|jgi:hypothetical protein|nr:hypothetical protein [Puniceicoccales bacterium]
MKNPTVTTVSRANIFSGARELQMPTPEGIPGSKLEPSFFREFSTFLEQGSSLPVAKVA